MRISREAMFMAMAEVAAMRSVCYRANVGALIVKDRDVVSIAYNGPASGEAHCEGHLCPKRADGACIRSIHAELNAITRAKKKVGGLLNLCELYCTWSPCLECAMEIMDARLYRVYYRNPYRLGTGIAAILDHPLYNVFRITPSGIVVSERTGEVV